MESRIKKYIQEAILEKYPGTDPDLDIDWEQLQIAFNAGIKEVVEWIKKNITIPYPVGSVGYISWQAKLKEWGLNV